MALYTEAEAQAIDFNHKADPVLVQITTNQSTELDWDAKEDRKVTLKLVSLKYIYSNCTYFDH